MLLAISSLFVGALLALRFRVMILLPAIAVGTALVIANGMFHGKDLMWTVIAATSFIVCVQAGYLSAAFLRTVATPAREARVVAGNLTSTRDWHDRH
jgi:hypothetical protein